MSLHSLKLGNPETERNKSPFILMYSVLNIFIALKKKKIATSFLRYNLNINGFQ